MLGLLALLPTIFKAVGSVTDLFNSGKKVVEKVTGKPSKASTPDELKQEVMGLPQHQQATFAERMKSEIQLYQEQTKRLVVEEGSLDVPALTEKLSNQAADEVAILRMTTRPWTVRACMYFILFPPILAAIDAVQHFIVIWLVQPVGSVLTTALGDFFKPVSTFEGALLFEYVFGIGLTAKNEAGSFADALAGSVMGSLYVDAMQWLIPVIVGYMGLREFGKWKRGSDDGIPTGNQFGLGGQGANMGGLAGTINQVADVAGQAASLISKMGNPFSSKR